MRMAIATAADISPFIAPATMNGLRMNDAFAPTRRMVCMVNLLE